MLCKEMPPKFFQKPFQQASQKFFPLSFPFFPPLSFLPSRQKSFYSLLVVALLSSPVLAQVDHHTPQKIVVSNPSIELSPVLVTALKEALTIEGSGATVAHFSAETLDRQNAQGLGDLFTYEPGVVADEGESGDLGDLRIRGMGQNRVLILVDGVELPPDYSFGRDVKTNRHFFDLDVMKEVNIIKGPMSTLYGGSALAGGVFMQTKDPEDFIKEGNQWGGQVKLGYHTSNREWHTALTGAGRFTEELSSFIRLTYKDGHEKRNYYGKATSESILGESRKHPNPLSSHTYNLLNKWVYEPNTHHKLSLTFEHFRDKFNGEHLSEIGGLNVIPDLSGTIPGGIASMYIHQGYKTTNENKRSQITFRHEFSNKNSFFDHGFWQAYYQQTKVTQISNEIRQQIWPLPVVFERYRQGNYKRENLGLSAEFNKHWQQSEGVSHDFAYGLNYRHSRMEASRYGDSINIANQQSVEKDIFPIKGEPDTRVNELGIYFQDRIGFMEDKLELIVGLRYDHYWLKPKHTPLYELNPHAILPPAKKNEHQFSKRLALLYHFTPEHTVFANYSEGFRAPDFNDVNTSYSSDDFMVIREANPQLKAERSKLYELGYHYNDSVNTFSLTGFYTDYKNFIDFQELGRVNPDYPAYNIHKRINLDKSYIYGLELKSHIELMRLQEEQGILGLNLSIAYAKGKDKNTKEPIDSVEPLTATVGLDYHYNEKLYLAANLKMVKAKSARHISSGLKDSRVWQDNNITHLPGYGVVNLIAEYKPYKDITINGGIYNLFNKQYSQWGDYILDKHTPSNPTRLSKPGINVALSVRFDF